MNERQDGCPRRLDTPRRILAAANSRLAGRWDDPAAWRVICEETAAVWRCSPDVSWAMICPRGALGLADAANGATETAAFWSAATGEVVWRENPLDARVWGVLAGARDGVLGACGPSDLPCRDLVAGAGLSLAGWLAVGTPTSGHPALALIVGLAREIAADPSDDPLAADLGICAAFLAPLVGQRRRLVDLAAEATAVRTECETLSRLGELRAHLAAVTAHELKTPLTSITAYAEVLEQQANAPEFAHRAEFLKVIRGEADRLLRLVDRLLDSSRQGRAPALAEPRPVRIGALADDVLRTMAPQASMHGLQLVGRVADDLPAVAGDDDLIRQVLLNLLGNALKFTPAGGCVVVSVREDAAMVRLAVSDDGPGIAPHELRAIFQSFYRVRNAARQTEGIGLGLSIVKEITSLHGGHLDVESRLGRGTTFTVLLPKEQHHGVAETVLSAVGCDPGHQQRVNELGLRLVAELALARGVMFLLPSADLSRLVPVASLGLGPDALGMVSSPGDDLLQASHDQARVTRLPRELGPVSGLRPGEVGAAMTAPLRLGDDDRRGLMIAARRLGGGPFCDDDVRLLQVLADVVGNAWRAVLEPSADRHVIDQVVEALSALGGLRRGGVPTADPLALRLLTRTARRLNMSSYEIRLLQYAGALHDTGMLLLDPDVLQKPGTLDADDREHVDRHPQRGLDVLGPLAGVPRLQQIIRHHHERFDGAGYPDGIAGDTIPAGARILAVVDAFFAMIRSRPWREGLPVAAALRELERNAGTQFDADVVAAFGSVLQETGFMAAASADRTVGSPPGR